MTRRRWNGTLPAPAKPIGRNAPMRRVSRKRRTWKFARNFHSREFVAFTHARPCWPCGARRNVQAAHILEARKMGGCGGDHRAVGPQCATCHHEWESEGGETFLRRRGLTWADAERAVAEHWVAFCRWREEGGAG